MDRRILERVNRDTTTFIFKWVNVEGYNVSNMSYVGDMVLIAKNIKNMQQLFDTVVIEVAETDFPLV